MQGMSTARNGLSPYPIVQAPMAGGASCPPLAAAVCEAGGLGFLAGGYKTADGMYQEIKRLRALTRRPFGVNLLMPQTGYVDPAAVETYRGQLAGEATWYEVSLAADDIVGSCDDGYDAKLAILLEDPVPVVSFTFGCPPAAVLTRLREAGTYTVVTVTGVEEARTAEAAGADAVCVQGVEAGGHQGTHRDDPEVDGTAGVGLLVLVAAVREAVALPIVAAGGVMRGAQIAALLAAGAAAAQLGTAFLPCRSPAPTPAQEGADQPAVPAHGTHPGLLRQARPGSGQPLHARARPVRPGGLPAGPPPDLGTAQGGGRRRGSAGHGAVGGAGPPAGAAAAGGGTGGGAGGGTRRGTECVEGHADEESVMTAPVFVVDKVPAGPEFVLDGPEGRHAVSVKRLNPGEDVVLTDGRGHWSEGVVKAAEGKDRLVVMDLESVQEEPEPAVRITVVQALPKGDRGELAVETMTETGVDAIVPWQASRCITQWRGERGAKSLAKWRATAREAGKQSRRVRFPEVAEALSTKQVAALLAEADLAVVLHEDRHTPSGALATAELPTEGSIVLVVGPEGGVSPEELAAFAAAGAHPYRLGASVLRTSTAGTAATAVLLARTGRWS